MTTKQQHQVTVASDFQVVGYNPENADMDRPRGEIIGEVFYLVATNERGDRWAWGGFDSAEDAETAFRLWAPPVFLWEETYPEYGSRAYQEYGEEDMIAWEARQLDAERWGFDTRFGAF